jgi:peptidoglycan/xylan/chitin deacetylase (PgdA/CDA1 family)
LVLFAGCAGGSASKNQAHPSVSPIGTATVSPQPTTPELAGGAESENRSGKQLLQTVQLSKKVFYNGTGDMKQVALTFDDGPDTKVTPQILDILKREDVKATFFIVGSRAKAHPEMVRRIVSEGHAVGNHSWSHPDFANISADQAVKQIRDTQDELASIIGYRPTIFRPPYGALNKEDGKAITAMGINIIDWSVDTMDWSGIPTKNILNLVHKELKPGGIILQHCAGGKKDHLANTVKALSILIPELRKQGYTFVTVPQLLNLPASMQ